MQNVGGRMPPDWQSKRLWEDLCWIPQVWTRNRSGLCSICDWVGRKPNTSSPSQLASWSLCINGAHWHAEWQTGRWEGGDPDRQNSQHTYKLGSLKHSHQTKRKSRFLNINTYLNRKAYFLYTFLWVWLYHGRNYDEEFISWRFGYGSCKNVSISFAWMPVYISVSSVRM
jgi:hypothetical protein